MIYYKHDDNKLIKQNTDNTIRCPRNTGGVGCTGRARPPRCETKKIVNKTRAGQPMPVIKEGHKYRPATTPRSLTGYYGSITTKSSVKWV